MPKRDLSAIAQSSSADLRPIQRGRGLTGLLSARSGVALENARRLPLDVIDFNPQQARQSFDEDTLAELAESIKHHDVLQPIGVRRIGERYQILFGERRYRAAVMAEKADIPVLIYEDLADTDAAILTALENLQREDLDLEDEARQFARLLELTGLSQRALAETLGKHRNYVNRRMLLLEHADVLLALRQGQVTQQEALRQVSHGGTEDADEVSHRGTPELKTPRAEMPSPTDARRWREITRVYRALGKLQPETVPIDEREALAVQLDELETLVATLKRALRAQPSESS